MSDLLDMSFEQVVEITLAEHITSREMYVERLHLKSHEIDAIIAPYDLPKSEWLICGLNNCPTLHGKGYLIRAKDGRETNCGWQCGSREFGADFDSFVTSYHEKQADRARRKVLNDARLQASSLLKKARLLLDQAKGWADKEKQITDQIEKDPALVRKAREVASRHGVVEVEERISEDVRRAMGTSDKFKTTTIANIRGMSALWNGGRVARTLDKITIPALEGIDQLNFTSITKNDEGQLTLQFSDIKHQIENAEKFISEAENLCNPSNILAITSLGAAMGRRSGRVNRALQAIKRLADSDPD